MTKREKLIGLLGKTMGVNCSHCKEFCDVNGGKCEYEPTNDFINETADKIIKITSQEETLNEYIDRICVEECDDAINDDEHPDNYLSFITSDY